MPPRPDMAASAVFTALIVDESHRLQYLSNIPVRFGTYNNESDATTLDKHA